MLIDKETYKHEFIELSKATVPMALSVTIYGLIYPITLAVCGSLGKHELDIAALAVSVFQVVIYSIDNSLRWSAISLFSQVNATGKKHRSAVILQRGLWIAISMWVFAVAFCLNIGNILILLGQIPDIAKGSEKFIWIMLPGCLCIFIFRLMTSFAECLGKYMPSIVISCFCVAIVFALQMLFVRGLNMGTTGAAVGLSCGMATLPLMMLVYSKYSGLFQGYWKGFTIRSLVQWKVFLKVFLPNFLMQTFYHVSTEIGTFIAGSFGPTHLAAQGIFFQLYTIFGNIQVGLCGSAMKRGGDLFTVGDSERGKVMLFLNMAMFYSTAVLFTIIMFGFGRLIPMIFISDEPVIDMYMDLLPWFVAYIDCFLVACSSLTITRVFNLHRLGAVVEGVAIWLVGEPIGISLAYATNLQLLGVWIGFVSGFASWAVVISFFAFRVLFSLRMQNLAQQVREEASKETDLEVYAAPQRDKQAGRVSTDEKSPLIENAKLEFVQNNGIVDHKLSKSSKKDVNVKMVIKSKLHLVIGQLFLLIALLIVRLNVPIVISSDTNFNSTTSSFLPVNVTLSNIDIDFL